jgi:hypothetical protein
MAAIDPIQLAQFCILPGAAELIEAFASLPPGEVRDSAVSHVQVLARACGWTAPPPFEGAHMARVVTPEAPRPPPRLASPFAADLKAESVEGQIVERALRGEPASHIADDLRLRLGLVDSIMDRARRDGVEFPGDGERRPVKRADPRKGRKLDRFPLPEPPYWWEDPDSPIWENGKLLPILCESGDGTMAGLGPLSSRAHGTMTQAAERAGLTLRQYLGRRFEILRRVEAGEPPQRLAIAMMIPAHTVYSLLARVGRGSLQKLIAAGKAQDGRKAAEAPAYRPEAQPASAGSLEPPRGISEDNRVAAEQAARRWGFKDVQALDDARHRVRELRMAGWGPNDIASAMRQPFAFVKNAMAYWKYHGTVWPPIKLGRKKRAA